jgi:hypothetical protein
MTTPEAGLSGAEAKELGEALASGDISRSCASARIDWFNVRLSGGVRVAGSYSWESEDFRDLRVYRNGRRA